MLRRARLPFRELVDVSQAHQYQFCTLTIVVQDAVDWLDKNADKSIEDLKAEDEAASEAKAQELAEQAKSYVCNDCGKKFRNTAEAEYHASKTEHQDFSESTDEIAPLTEEEKKAKLADLKERMAAKRAVQAEQDKKDAKRNEQISRKKTKESEDLKEQLRAKEQIKEAEKKRKEKQDDIEAKKRIQARIAADKEERRLKAEREKAERAGVALPQAQSAAPVSAAPTTSKPASEYTEARLRLQTSGGNIMKTFPVDTTLFEVASAIGDEIGRDVESFTQNFPRKVFDKEYFDQTLKELKLVPSASLIVK
jgi:UBX domain-containing protein 1/4